MRADNSLERIITHVLKVPPRPEPPTGAPGTLQVFNAAPGFYRYRLLGWVLRQVGTAIGLILGLVFLDRIEFGPIWIVGGLIRVFEVVGVGGFLAQLPFSFLMVRLDYRYRWYMITDTTLRVREGLIAIREQTMTFANIQNLSIRQGPLQRFFGIADLKVRTAGGGENVEGAEELSKFANMHLGYFRGVDNAAEIRDLIVGRMRGQSDTGLGDPDEVAPGPARAVAADVEQMVSAARALRDEARRLRVALGVARDNS